MNISLVEQELDRAQSLRLQIEESFVLTAEDRVDEACQALAHVTAQIADLRQQLAAAQQNKAAQ